MPSDPIVAEIRQIRELRAARFDFDVRAIVQDAQQRDARGDCRIVRLPPRPVATPMARDADTS